VGKETRLKIVDRLALLEARARRALGERAVKEVLKTARAIIGVPNLPKGEEAAQRCLDKLRKPKLGKPTAAELAALELVIRMLRPAPACEGGELLPLPGGPGDHLYSTDLAAQWDAFRAAVKPLLFSIGRVDSLDENTGHVGTGFLVSPSLLVTNRHVLGILSLGSEELEAGLAVVKFNQENGVPDPEGSEVPITGVAAIHPQLDMVLLRIDAQPTRPPLEIQSTPIAVQEFVATIGYPSQDSFRNPIFANAIFKTQYGTKRGALGEILDLGPMTIFHDCSTMGGNSGSPIFSMRTGRVIGLHRSGFFMYRNEGIAVDPLFDFIQAFPALTRA
jgi:hypothetical protein